MTEAFDANAVMGGLVGAPTPNAPPNAPRPNVTGLLVRILAVFLPLVIGAGLFYTIEYDKEYEQRYLDINDQIEEYFYGVYGASPYLIEQNIFGFLSICMIITAVIEVKDENGTMFDGNSNQRLSQGVKFLFGWFSISFIVLNVLYVIKKEENREIEKETKEYDVVKFKCPDPCVPGEVLTVNDLEFTIPVETDVGHILYYTDPDGHKYPLYGQTEPRFGVCSAPENNEGYIISTCNEIATVPVETDTANCAAVLDESGCDEVMVDCASADTDGTAGSCPTGCDEEIIDDVTVCSGTSTKPACSHTGNYNLNTGPNEFNIDVKCDDNNFYRPLLWGWDGGKAEECDFDDDEYILSNCHKNGDMYIFIMVIVILLIVRFRLKLKVGTKQKIMNVSLFLGFFVVLTISIRSSINGFNLNEKISKQINDKMGIDLSTMTILISGLVNIIIATGVFYMGNTDIA